MKNTWLFGHLPLHNSHGNNVEMMYCSGLHEPYTLLKAKIRRDDGNWNTMSTGARVGCQQQRDVVFANPKLPSNRDQERISKNGCQEHG